MKSFSAGLPLLLTCVAFSFGSRLTSDAACVPATSGMVSWWPGESNTLDVVGTNHGTAYNSVTFAPGMVGFSFNLNGTGAHVRVPDSPSLHFSNALTIEGWIFP